MKKTNLIKVISILLISVMVMLFFTTVNAANDDGFTELTVGNNTSGNNTSGNNTPSNNTPTNNTPSNNTSKNNTTNNANSSVYNNSNLPKTGISDSIPVAMLVVVFGISAVYAYKKINDYRNI